MKKHNHALSLLEVMISIGIVAVGILGILAILPVAGFRAQQGDTHLRNAETGENAAAKFKTYGMRQPESWRIANAAAPTPTQVPTLDRRSYAIDPMHVALVDGRAIPVPGLSFPVGTRPDNTVFAPPAANPPTMQRVSLGRQHNEAAGSLTFLTRAQAEEIFVEQNDLAIDPNPNPTQPPIQELVPDGAGIPQKRESEGRFSWMATIVPNVRDATTIGQEETYTLSIVVFQNRIIPFDDSTTPMVNEGADKTAQVTTFYSGGIGGGDVQLSATDPVNDPNSALALSQLKEGHWIMLAGTIPGPQPLGIFRWYRVINIDPQLTQDASGNPARDVTLDGPDWDINIPAYVWLPETAIGVYERAIRLEAPSNIWAN